MDIKNTKDTIGKRVTAFIYGPSGIGKTTLASTLEGRTLIVSAESGLLSLAGKSIDYIEVVGKTASEKIESLRIAISIILKNTDAYDNIFVDSLTEIGQIMSEYQLDLVSNDKSKSLLAWGEYFKQMRGFIKVIRDMSQFNVIVTSLEKTSQDEYQRRFVTPDLQGSISTQVSQYFDEVFYYNYDCKEDKTERVLYTDGLKNVLCKDRSGRLDKIEKPNLAEIFKKIGD